MEPVTLILELILFSFGTGSLFHACFFYPISSFMKPIPNFLLHFLY